MNDDLDWMRCYLGFYLCICSTLRCFIDGFAFSIYCSKILVVAQPLLLAINVLYLQFGVLCLQICAYCIMCSTLAHAVMKDHLMLYCCVCNNVLLKTCSFLFRYQCLQYADSMAVVKQHPYQSIGVANVKEHHHIIYVNF